MAVSDRTDVQFKGIRRPDLNHGDSKKDNRANFNPKKSPVVNLSAINNPLLPRQVFESLKTAVKEIKENEKTVITDDQIKNVDSLVTKIEKKKEKEITSAETSDLKEVIKYIKLASNVDNRLILQLEALEKRCPKPILIQPHRVD